MAREIEYRIVVNDTQATAKVADFERRATTAGTQTSGLATATRDLATAQASVDKQTSSMIGTVNKYGGSVTDVAGKVGGLATTLDAQSQALQQTDRMLEKLEARYPSVVASTVEMETATTAASTATAGLLTQVTGAIATFAPYALAAEVVTEMIIGWYEAHERAAVATETAAAKQDVIQHAFQLSHGVTMTYADAVKYLNEQFQRQPGFVDNAKDALEHWNVALQKGPLNAQQFAAQDLAKNVADAFHVVQTELGHIGFDTVQKGLDLLREHTVLSDAAFNQWAKDLGLSSITVASLKDQVKAEADTQRTAEEATKRHTAEIDRQARATQSLIDAADKQRGELSGFFFGADELEKAERTVDVVTQIAHSMNVMELSAERQKAAKQLIDQAFDDYVIRGKAVSEEMLQVAAALWAVTVPAAKLGSLGGFGGPPGPIPSSSLTMSNGEAIPAQIPNIAGHSGTQFAVSWWDGFSGSLEHYFGSGQFTNLMVHALTSGGDIGHAVAAAGVQVGQLYLQSMMKGMGNAHVGLATAGIAVGSSLLANHDEGVKGIGEDIGGGAMTGAAIGSIIPGIGTAIGTAIGAGVGAVAGAIKHWIQSMGPSQAELSGRQLEGQFEQSFGGFQEMMLAVGKAYAATGHSAQQAQADVKGLLDAERQGPAAVQAWLDKIKQVTDAYALQETALQDVNDAAQRYGITIEELGPALQRQNLDQTAQQLYKDWKLLTSAGVDQNVVIGHMSDSINDYVHDALRMGIEIPAAMRPMLQQMAEMGKLTDENGNIITDLGQSGVHFAQTMTEGFQKVVDAVERLAIAIEQKLGLALDSVHDKTITITTKYETAGHPDVPGLPGGDTPGNTPTGNPGKYGYNEDGSPDWDGDPTNSMKFGGFGYAAGPMTFTTKGNEFYAFSGEGKSFAGFAGASASTDPALLAELRALRAEVRSGMQLPPIYLDGRVVAERTFELATKGKYGLDKAAKDAVGLS